MRCDIKKCNEDGFITIIGVELCEKHWEKSCNNHPLHTKKKGLLTKDKFGKTILQ